MSTIDNKLKKQTISRQPAMNMPDSTANRNDAAAKSSTAESAADTAPQAPARSENTQLDQVDRSESAGRHVALHAESGDFPTEGISSPDMQAELMANLQSSMLASPAVAMTGASTGWEKREPSVALLRADVTPQKLTAQIKDLVVSLRRSGLTDNQLGALTTTASRLEKLTAGPLASWDTHAPIPQRQVAVQARQVASLTSVLQGLLRQLSHLPPLPLDRKPAAPASQSGTTTARNASASKSDKPADMADKEEIPREVAIANLAKQAGMTGPLSFEDQIFLSLMLYAVKQEKELWKNIKKLDEAKKKAEAERKKQAEEQLKLTMNMMFAGDKKIREYAKSPEAMAMASPEMKAHMIKKLIKGYTNSKDDRAMLDILESCKTKEEFDQVMKLAGGKKVADEIDHGPTKQRLNKLCYMWGRPEWAQVRSGPFGGGNELKECETVRNALIDPKKGAELAGLDEATIARYTAPIDPNTLSKDPGERARQIAEHQRQVNAFNIHLENKAYKELIMENGGRLARGEPPLDWAKVNAEVYEVMEADYTTIQPTQYGRFPISPEKQKEAKLEEIRKKYGLSKDSMRELYTQRHSYVYRRSAAELEQAAKTALKQYDLNISKLIGQHGEGSDEVKEARVKREQFREDVKVEQEKLEKTAEFAAKLYPVPSSFFEKLVNAIASIGKFLLKVLDFLGPLVNLIPGVGQALYMAHRAYKAILAFASGNWQAMLGAAAGLAGGIGNAVGGALGRGLETASTVAQTTSGLATAIATGDPMAILGAAGGVAGGLGGVGGSFGSTMQDAQKLLNTGATAASAIQGAAEGDWERAFGGLGSLAQQTGQMAGGATGEFMAKTGQAMAVASDLAGGNYAGALGGFNSALTPFVDSPTVQEVMRYTEPGLLFAESIASGDYGRAGQMFLDQAAPYAGSIPGVTETLEMVRPTVEFVEGLRDGSACRSLEALQSGLDGVIDHPALQTGLGWAKDTCQLLEAAQAKDPRAMAEFLGQSPTVATLVQSIDGGGFVTGLRGYASDVEALLKSPDLQEARRWYQNGAAFIDALQTHKLDRALASLDRDGNPLSGLPALSDLLEQTREAQTYIQGLQSGALDRALGELEHTLPELKGAGAYQEFLARTAPAVGFFRDLGSDHHAFTLAQIERQLARVATPDELLAELNPVVRELAELKEELAALPEQAASFAGLFGPQSAAVPG